MPLGAPSAARTYGLAICRCGLPSGSSTHDGRHDELKLGAWVVIVQMDLGVHLDGERCDQRQANAGALGLPGQLILGTVKELKDPLHLVTGDPWPVVPRQCVVAAVASKDPCQ